ncbi:hypothetical protein [Lentibacillus sediminis]|uniref:hypothetical protein n=1 Tax=Lentibacillus sediminis TaxID=1940529 RepID=UPI000C1C69AB|nr:hypothetical protein [Lentibacillus sediminis]
MGVYEVSGNRLSSVQQTGLTLRPGQIIQGKILKLYPGNKAQIQLGAHKMTAQLEASLSAGNAYHFQVQSTGKMVHLSVLGESGRNKEREGINHLLKQLNLPMGKANAVFVEGLVRAGIPFDKQQLVRAFGFLGGTANKSAAQQILQQMVLHKYPMTQGVFQALSAVQTGSLTNHTQALLEQVDRQPGQQQLAGQLRSILGGGTSGDSAFLVQNIRQEAIQNNQTLFTILRAAGAIKSGIPFSQWKTAWQSSAGQAPVQFSQASAISGLEQLQASRPELQVEAKQFLQTWGGRIAESVRANAPLAEADFIQLKQHAATLTAQGAKQVAQAHLQNTSASIQQLMQMMETLGDDTSYARIAENLVNGSQSQLLPATALRQNLITHMNQILLFTGLSYEHQIANDQLPSQLPVKAMLMQLLQQGDGGTEQARNLLNFINGMQLQSVQETSHYIHASLQLPHEPLGLNEDLLLEFEGRKTEDGEISPDHCRILFYLDLQHVNKTVIDMHIQKRSVSVAVFNDNASSGHRFKELEQQLKSGLDSLNYQLGAVTFKPLTEEFKGETGSSRKQAVFNYKGVDYRV